jgi:hypothetical protein
LMAPLRLGFLVSDATQTRRQRDAAPSKKAPASAGAV